MFKLEPNKQYKQYSILYYNDQFISDEVVIEEGIISLDFYTIDIIFINQLTKSEIKNTIKIQGVFKEAYLNVFNY